MNSSDKSESNRISFLTDSQNIDARLQTLGRIFQIEVQFKPDLREFCVVFQEKRALKNIRL